VYPSGAFYMASCTHTHFNDVLAGRLHAELMVKPGDPNQLGRCDLGFFAHVAQSLLGQVVVSLLNSLKDGDQRIAGCSLLRDDLVDMIVID